MPAPPQPPPSLVCEVGCGSQDPGREADEEMLEALVEDVQPGITLPEFACPHDPADVPTFSVADDSAVPAFRPDGERGTNMYSGDERLPDGTLMRHLQAASDEVFACFDLAACYVDEVAGGTLEFSLHVQPTGTVSGVDVNASEHYEDLGITACARRAIYDAQFPAYDGGGMWVTYALEID